MDFLGNFRGPANGSAGWAPTAEKVLAPAQLVDGAAPRAEAPPAPAPSRERAEPDPADDLAELGDLTYAELARRSGLDPDEAERRIPGRLTKIGRPAVPEDLGFEGDLVVDGDAVRPAPMPHPALGAPPAPAPPEGGAYPPPSPAAGFAPPTRTAAFAPLPAPAPTPRPRPTSAPVDRSTLVQPMPTWPPPGERPEWSPRPAAGKQLGPVPSKHRPDPRRTARRRGLAAVVLLAVVVASVWYFALRPEHTGPPPAPAHPAAAAGVPAGAAASAGGRGAPG